MDDMNKWYSVTRASEQVGIPSETVRRYIRQYGDYLYTKRGEKRSYLIHESSLETLSKIRYLLENDYSREQIDEILQQTEQVVIQPNDAQMDEQLNEYMMTLPQLQKETENHMRAMNDQINEQNEMIRQLSEQIKQQQDHIEKSINERDDKLMNTMNELLEDRKKEKQKGFWKRLFNID